MAEAYKHTGPVTAAEVVALWMVWCKRNGLPPPEFTLIDPEHPDHATMVAVVPLETQP